MAGEVQQKDVLRPALREQILDLPLDYVRRLIPDDLDVEVSNLGIGEHRSQRLGVGAGRQQVLEPFVLVHVVGDDQRRTLSGHWMPPWVSCRLTNKSINRCCSTADAS